jgi:hypothetical protein
MRIGGLFVAIAALVIVPAANGDAVYHLQHVALNPVAPSESGNGFVENIHANRPVVFAHEQYVLRGALPLTTYTVVLHVFSPVDATCAATTPVLVEPTAAFTTNPAGNGSAYHVFTPADVDGLHGSTVSAYWTLSTGGAGGPVAYRTTCQTIQLD